MNQRLKKLLFLFFLLSFSNTFFGQIPQNNLQLWLQGGKGYKFDASKRISFWQDFSKNKNHAKQTTALSRPFLAKDVCNGLDLPSFDGTNLSLECAPKFPTNSSFTMTAVVRAKNYGAYNVILGGGNNQFFWMGATSQTTLFGAGSGQITSKSPIKPGFNVITIIVDIPNKKIQQYINGVLDVDSNKTYKNNDNGISIGSFFSYYNFNGEIGEIALYNAPVSGKSLDSLHNYLLNKFMIDGGIHKDISFSKFPKELEFFPRLSNDSGEIKIAGKIKSSLLDTLQIEILKNGISYDKKLFTLNYSTGKDSFSSIFKLQGGLFSYSAVVSYISGLDTVPIAKREHLVCGDAYIIDGQSNTVYIDHLDQETNEFIRSFGRNKIFQPITEDTFFNYGNGGSWNYLYFNGQWGYKLQKMVVDSFKMPSLLINGGVGGTTIEQHYRYDPDPTNVLTIYGGILNRARQSGMSNYVRALFWYQGESNTGTGYMDKFKLMHKNWKKDFPNLKKIYVVQIHPGCAGNHLQIREDQRNLQDTFPDVEVIAASGLPGHDGCHYQEIGYTTLAKNFGPLFINQLYGIQDSLNLRSLNVDKAFYTDTNQKQICILFKDKNYGLKFSKDTSVVTNTGKSFKFNIRHAFYINDSFGKVSSVSINGDSLFLNLDKKYPTVRITYCPDQYYENCSTATYEGPWLFNKRNNGALTFYNIPVYKFPIADFLTVPFCDNAIGYLKDNSFPNKDGSQIIKYEWDFGTGFKNLGKVAGATFSTATLTPSATLKVTTNKGLSASIKKSIKVYPNPSADFTFKQQYPSLRQVLFTPINLGASSYSWDFGDGTNSNKKSRLYTYSNGGDTFQVSLMVRDSLGCKDSVSKSIVLSNLVSIQNGTDFFNEKINLYPNPAKSILNIEGNFDKNDFFDLVDLSGRTIQHFSILGKENFKQINLENLPSGIYLLKYYNSKSNKNIFNKIEKE